MDDALYASHARRERAISEAAIAARLRFDLPILAQQNKCSVSVDLPPLNSLPTKVCAAVSYAAQGQQAFRGELVKNLALACLFAEAP